MTKLEKYYWLVIDDLNDPDVTPSIRETAYAIACAVEVSRPERLWVALLGYNAETAAGDLRWAAAEDASFPTVSHLSEHFRAMSCTSPNPITLECAREHAERLVARYPVLDKEAMIRLTFDIEQKSRELLSGQCGGRL